MKFLKMFLFLLVISCASAMAQNHSATLTWAWSQGTGDPATGFHVQRATVTGGPYGVVATVPSPTTLTFVDTSVSAGQTYFYVVTAFNTAAATTANPGGDSAFSNQVTCAIPFQSPSTPTGLSGTVK